MEQYESVMKRKRLGNTGIEVSEIAFGGVEIGMPYGIGVKSAVDMLAEDAAIRLLNKALDRGINFFDTARLYGESERIIGKAFQGKREQIVLATKCTHFKQPDGTVPTFPRLKDVVRNSLSESLKMLRTEYIDLYMVHYADGDVLEDDGVLRIFTELKDEGYVRAVGVSVYKPEETRIAVTSGVWDAIQLPFNLLDQSHGKHFEEALHQGVGIIVRSVLMRGMLTNRIQQLHPALYKVEKYIHSYRKLLDGKFNGLPQFATQFALSHDAVSSVLVGIDKHQYLEEALACATGQYFDEALLKQAKSMAYPQPEFLNLAEWDKNGWL